MRPNTPHLVVTTESSICHGGHFIATATLRQTCHGIFHTFIASSLLTNTEHTTASRDLLRRLLAYFLKAFQTDYIANKLPKKGMASKYIGKIPDVFTFDGLLDVFSLCNIMELGNIIHYKTYTDDGLGPIQRQKMIEGRAIARHVRHWVTCMVELHDSHQNPTLRSVEQDLFYPYLASQALALVNYKRRASTADAHGNSDFSLEDLEDKIHRSFSDDSGFMAHYKSSIDPGTFDWTGPPLQVCPTAVDGYQPPGKLTGETQDDRLWRMEHGRILVKKITGAGSSAGKPITLDMDMDTDDPMVEPETDALQSPKHIPSVEPSSSRKRRRIA